MITIYVSESGFTAPVRATPKGGRQCILPFSAGDEAIRVKVTAAPADGKANEAIVKLLAETLGVAKRCVELTHGATSRQKRFRISCDDASATLERLAHAMGSTVDECFELRPAGA